MRYLYILRYLCGLFWLIQLANLVEGQVADVTAPHATLRLGSGQPLEVRIENAESGLTLRVGALRVALPVHAATSLTTETVDLRGGASVGLVRLSAAQENAAVLLVRRGGAKLEALWVGRLDFIGDPGERRADGIEVGDLDADGQPDIVVGHYDERVSVCGERRTLLSPRAIDPSTLTLRSVLLNRARQRTVSLQLQAAPTAPDASLDPPPVLRALRPLAASSASTDPAHGIRALADGDTRTYWEEGRGLGGRYEFASFAWDAPSRPIVAIALVPVPVDAGNANHTKLQSLSVLGPNQEHWKVRLPAQLQPGQRYWVTPPKPLSWRCLTLAIDENDDGTSPVAQVHASLAEVEAYTDLDLAGGLAQLVREISEPGARGDDATALLRQARGDVTGALVQAWPNLSPTGRRRALRLLFQNPAAADPRSEDVLRNALRDPDRDVSAQALELVTGGKVVFGSSLLVELAHSATAPGDQAAQTIGSSKQPDALEALLAILAEPGASERPALREAVAMAYQNAVPNGSEALHAWLGDEGRTKPRAARIALALALSHVEEARPAATQLVHELMVDAGDFEEQWRLVQATRSLPSEPRGDGFLEGLALRADTWMLRSAALEALAARKAPGVEKAAEHALGDQYPRVRASAVAVLSKSPDAFELLSKTARNDKWFLVRRAALDQLPDSPRTRSWFMASLSDPIATVRAAAIRALARVGAVEAWQKIEPALQNPEEYPEVIAEGVAFARRLCVRAAMPSLQMVATRGLKPDAWTKDQELALDALEVLSSLGGEAAIWARDRATSALVPKEVQLAAAAAVHQPPACVPKGPEL